MFIHIFNNTIGNLPAALNTDVINNAITAISYIMIIPAIVLLVVLWNTNPEINEKSPYRL